MNTHLRDQRGRVHRLLLAVVETAACFQFACSVSALAAENASGTNAVPTAPAETSRALAPGELRLNFRGAPIEMVLNYLSDAAGFIIQLNTPVHGTVDAWSQQPVTREEALRLLDTVLNRNGYAAIRNGRLLTIMTRDDALHGDIPVRVSNDPETIEKTDEIITLIIPVRFVEAEQLVKDLSSLVSSHASIIANAAGNSVIVTDTQANIRHLAEIVKAVDDSAEDMTELHVYRLKHHDPAEIAELLNNLFSDQSSSSSSSAQPPFMFGGPGGGPGDFGGGSRRNRSSSSSSSSSAQSARVKQRARVVAVADPRTVSVVVSSSKDMAGQIGEMITQLDQDSPKVARVSVIHLENADPQQVQQVLEDMFQSSTSSRSSSTQDSLLQNRIQQQSTTTSSSSSSSSMGSLKSSSGLSSF